MVAGRGPGHGGAIDEHTSELFSAAAPAVSTRTAGVMGRPRPGYVAVAAVLVFLAAVGCLVRYELGYPLNPFALFGRSSSAEGRRELRAIRRDPVLAFRAAGARLRHRTEEPAGTDWWNAHQPTEIRQLFSLSAEPGVAVEAYARRAEEAGWHMVERSCSFELRSTSVRLTRTIGGRPATLVVYGTLERPQPGISYRRLLVKVTGEVPDRPPQGPEGAGLRRRDVHCLRNFDPSSPALLPPSRRPGSPAELCGLLALADARRLVPAVTTMHPGVNVGPTCYYGDIVKGGFLLRAAEHPRAYYEDRQSAQESGDPRYLLTEEPTSPGRASGAWVDTRLGPVEIYGGSTPGGPGLDARRLAAVAQLLVRPPVPTGTDNSG